MAERLINQLNSGSVNDGSLIVTGDPQSGILSQTSYKAAKDYFQQGITFNTGSFVLTASYIQDSGSFDTRIKNTLISQSSYTQLSLFNSYTSSFSASYHADSASFDFRIRNITGSSGGSGSSSQVLNFIIGDGQSFTPASSSTVFSSSVIVNRTILQLSQEGSSIAPVSRSVAWFSITSSIGKINLNNTSFVQDAYYQIIYT